MTPPMVPRRAVMIGATIAGLGLARSAQAASGPAQASGTVYQQAGEAREGLPGILVSNGQDVVATGADGRWTLPVDDGESLFVIKPTGWTTPIDPATQLPAFTYVHSPDGTPAARHFRFPGLQPTGPLPQSIDFELRRQDEPTRFDALLLTDPQPESAVELGYVRDDVVARFGEHQAAFAMALGDLMFDDLAFYDRFNRMMGTAGMPWHACPGNHDMNYEAPDDALSRETFKRVYGARHHAFQYGGATFILLDNVAYLGTDPARPLAAGHYRGRFGPRQLAFVRNVLAHVPRDSLVVIGHHIPLYTLQSAEPANVNTDTADFLAAVATHPNCVSFSGHTHTNEHWYLGPDGKPAADGNYQVGHHHSRAVGGQRQLVERSGRCARHSRGTCHRRQPQRLPHPLGRWRACQHAADRLARSGRHAAAHRARQPGARDVTGSAGRVSTGGPADRPDLGGPVWLHTRAGEFLRRRPARDGRAGGRAWRIRRDDTGRPHRPVRGGGVRPQCRHPETMGEAGAVLPSLAG